MLKSIFVVTVLLAFFSSSPGFAWRNIFGNDPREDVKAQDGRYAYPFEAHGRTSNGCTVALVGKRLGLTAAHCVVDSESGAVLKSLTSVEFNLVDGVARTQVKVAAMWVGTFSPVQQRMKDWAILQFDAPVDADIRRLKLRKHDFETTAMPYAVSLAGYNGDRKGGKHLSVVTDCGIRERVKKKEGEKDVQEGLLLNDCASSAGISGAPMLVYDGDEALVEAIAVSERRKGPTTVTKDEYTAEFANIAIPINAAADTLTKLIKTVDAGLAPPKISGAFALKPVDATGQPTTPPPTTGTGTNSLGELEALYEKSTAVGVSEVYGWWVGRCYVFSAPRRALAGVLMGLKSDFEGRWAFLPLFHQSAEGNYYDELTGGQESDLVSVARAIYPQFSWPSLSHGTLLERYTPNDYLSVQWQLRRHQDGYILRIHTLKSDLQPVGATNAMCHFPKKVRDYRTRI